MWSLPSGDQQATKTGYLPDWRTIRQIEANTKCWHSKWGGGRVFCDFMRQEVALETGFELWDFNLEATGDDISWEGRLRANMWTEVCPRSKRNCLYINTCSSWSVKVTAGVTADCASHSFHSTSPQVLWLFSLKSPTAPCLLHFSSSIVLQQMSTCLSSFFLGGLWSTLHTATRANLGKANVPLPRAFYTPSTVAIRREPISPTLAWVPQSEEPWLKCPLYLSKLCEQLCPPELCNQTSVVSSMKWGSRVAFIGIFVTDSPPPLSLPPAPGPCLCPRVRGFSLCLTSILPSPLFFLPPVFRNSSPATPPLGNLLLSSLLSSPWDLP